MYYCQIEEMNYNIYFGETKYMTSVMVGYFSQQFFLKHKRSYKVVYPDDIQAHKQIFYASLYLALLCNVLLPQIVEFVWIPRNILLLETSDSYYDAIYPKCIHN